MMCVCVSVCVVPLVCVFLPMRFCFHTMCVDLRIRVIIVLSERDPVCNHNGQRLCWLWLILNDILSHWQRTGQSARAHTHTHTQTNNTKQTHCDSIMSTSRHRFLVSRHNSRRREWKYEDKDNTIVCSQWHWKSQCKLSVLFMSVCVCVCLCC